MNRPDVTHPIKILIADDEPAARLALTKRLEALGRNTKICGEAKNGKETERLIAALAPDVVFLDISMPGPNGLDLARKLSGEDAPLVVFLTAYDDRAVEAYETDAIDYLTKPVSPERLNRAIERVYAELEKRRQLKLSGQLRAIVDQFEPGAASKSKIIDRCLTLNVGNGVIRLLESDIWWVEAAGEYACVHAKGETHIVRETLKRLEQDLLPEHFFRIHRQTIVNLDKVGRIESRDNQDHVVRLRNDREFPISRRKLASLKAALIDRGTSEQH